MLIINVFLKPLILLSIPSKNAFCETDWDGSVDLC